MKKTYFKIDILVLIFNKWLLIMPMVLTMYDQSETGYFDENPGVKPVLMNYLYPPHLLNIYPFFLFF